jgi:hypothetical protein
MGHFGNTYLPMSDVFYTMPITLVQFLLRYLPTPKSDVLYERSLTGNALEQVQRVHEPAVLWDITFCTH